MQHLHTTSPITERPDDAYAGPCFNYILAGKKTLKKSLVCQLAVHASHDSWPHHPHGSTIDVASVSDRDGVINI
jgi:hypothetical protein